MYITGARGQSTILIVDQTRVIFGVGSRSIDRLIAGLPVTNPCVVFVLAHDLTKNALVNDTNQ